MFSSYRSKFEAAEDHANLDRMRAALNAARSATRRDECGLCTIRGSRGYVSTWGDGQTWSMTVILGTTPRWTWAKRRLAAFPGLAQVSQDGDTEGVVRLMRMPMQAEAAEIRRIAGLRQSRRSPPIGTRFASTKGGGSRRPCAQSDLPTTPLAGSFRGDSSTANPAAEARETARDRPAERPHDGGDA
jgi:hypothetical protein